jgi:hypothetical protein
MMADLISRAAAIDYLMTNMGWRNEDGYEVDDADEKRAIITDLVNGIPSVDAVPVIRCRDCKYGKLCFDANGQGLIQCTNPYYPASFVETWPFDLDWYCAGGERKDSE